MLSKNEEMGLVFDFDGVVCDTEELHANAKLTYLERMGYSLPLEILEAHAGRKNSDIWREIKKIINIEKDVETLVRESRQFVLDFILQLEIQPTVGVPELLQELSEASVPMAIGSMGDRRRIEYLLEMFKLRRFFSALVCGDDVANGKPAPDIFLKAAESIQMPPERCIVIEDSTPGVLAARRARMKALGFRNPESQIQDLSNAHHVFNDFRDLSFDFLQNILNNKGITT